MRKRKIGWILAVSMALTQNIGVWAQEPIEPGQLEAPEYREEMTLEEIEADYQDRFIVKYKRESLFGSGETTPSDLTEAARQAYETAFKEKEKRIADIGAEQEAAAVEDSLALNAQKYEMEEWASVSAEEWKPGYLLFDLGEKVDPELFMAEMEAACGIEYIQPDYELELSDISLELEILGEAEEGAAPQETAEPAEKTAEPADPISSAKPGEEAGSTAEPADTPEPIPEETDEPVETENPEAAENPEPKEDPKMPEEPLKTEEPEKTPGPTEEPAGRVVKVAVIDGGVDITHEMLAERITDAWDFAADTALTCDEAQKDQYYHGTHVAGIIAQTAPSAQIIPLQVFEQGKAYTSDIIDAIAYAKEHGAEIVNCSWGSTDNNRILRETMEESEMLFICAAGNSRMDIDETPVYPAAFELENIISVAALNQDQGFSYFSNYGTENVDIAAPGRDIESAWPGNRYGKMSGTSMAAAAVTGGAALAAGLGEEDVKARILETADRLSNLEQKAGGKRALNIENLTGNISGEEKTISPAEDFDVHGYQPAPAEAWEQFCSLDTVQVAAGGDFTMVLKGDGTVYAWGDNTNGQLGAENQYDNQKERAEVGQIPGLSGVTAIAAGPGYALALKNDGTVYAWGDNAYGQLGNGTKTETYVPAQVTGLTDVIQISAGRLHSAAVTEDGSLYMWGNNNRGQLGDGTTDEHLIPVRISGLPAVYEAAAGGSHTAVAAENGIYAWGDNTYGQLGDGTRTRRFSPVKTNLSGQIQHIAAGLSHTAAVRSDGTVYTWGDNASGQLGDGTVTDSVHPAIVSGLPAVQAISAGEAFCAAITEDGEVYTWGDNSYGQLGDGTTQSSALPVQTIDIENVEQISAGKQHAIAVSKANALFAWGSNSHYQIGINRTKSAQPIAVYRLDQIKTAAAGVHHNLAVREDGTVVAWGYNNFGQLGTGTNINYGDPVRIPNLTDVQSVAAGYYHSLALKGDGTVYAWGQNLYGQLGTGKTGNSAPPTIVPGLTDIVAIAAGAYYSMALKSDGTVYTWGRNNVGQLGNGTFEDSLEPVQIQNLANIKSISAGYYNSYAIREDGKLYAWGTQQFGQVGTYAEGDQSTPVQVDIEPVKAVAAGVNHVLALTEKNEVYAWGHNQYGQLGLSEYNRSVFRKTKVAALKDIQFIAAGLQHSLAVKTDGTVLAWGNNSAGQIGSSTAVDAGLPLTVQGTVGAVSVFGGGEHSLALKADGTMVAWGNNGSGQLGDGSYGRRLSPYLFDGRYNDGQGDVREDAHMIDINIAAEYTIDYVGDQDWMCFMIDKSGEYKISVEASIPVVGTLYQNEKVLRTNSGTSFEISETLFAGRQYYLQMSSRAEETGKYMLWAERIVSENSQNILEITGILDKTITIAAKAGNVESFADLAFNLTYDPEKLEVVNLTAQNFEKLTQPGQCGNVEIQSATPGYIRFRMLNMPEETGMVWNGVLNLFQFRFIGETGEVSEIQLDYEQEGGE